MTDASRREQAGHDLTVNTDPSTAVDSIWGECSCGWRSGHQAVHPDFPWAAQERVVYAAREHVLLAAQQEAEDRIERLRRAAGAARAYSATMRGGCVYCGEASCHHTTASGTESLVAALDALLPGDLGG